MTSNEARIILGLGPDEDPRPHLGEFRAARERIAEMVRTAPNETLAVRYQQGLVEFDQALAAVREYLEALGLDAGPLSSPAPEPEVAVVATSPEPAAEPRPARKSRSWIAWLFVFLIGIAGGGLLYFKNEQAKESRRQVRLTLLERLGSEFVENRRWQDAAAAFDEIETLAPGSEIASLGRRSIEAGMTEEQSQFIGYWTGQAIAELEAGRLDEAEKAARRVLARIPTEKDAAAILRRIAAARESQSLATAIAAARKLLDDRQPEQAREAAQAILAKWPDEAAARSLIEQASTVIAKAAADQARAMSLLQQAAARGEEEFDQQALDWLREAAALAPDNREIAAKLEKMSSHTRTLRVPGDFATPAEALAAARDRDRIVLADRTWKGPLVVSAAVELQGSGPGKTIIECPAAEGSAITVTPETKGARISGITFRHEAFAVTGTERFAAALVRGGGATFVDCHFTGASGHGLAVIESGEAIAQRCRFAENGWNGAAAIGKGSFLEARDCEALENFEHGIESWDEAGVTLVNNRCEGNSLNGIHIQNGSAAAVIEDNQLAANREFGLVLDSAGSGRVTGNEARANLMGGFVIRAEAITVLVRDNQAASNQGPGLVIEQGLPPAAYQDNTLTNNSKPGILSGVKLAVPSVNPAPEMPAPEKEP